MNNQFCFESKSAANYFIAKAICKWKSCRQIKKILSSNLKAINIFEDLCQKKQLCVLLWHQERLLNPSKGLRFYINHDKNNHKYKQGLCSLLVDIPWSPLPLFMGIYDDLDPNPNPNDWKKLGHPDFGRSVQYKVIFCVFTTPNYNSTHNHNLGLTRILWNCLFHHICDQPFGSYLGLVMKLPIFVLTYTFQMS